MRRDKGEIDSWIYNGITTSIQEQIMEHMNAIRSLEEELERLKQECKDLQQRIDEALKEAERPQSEVPEEENTVRAA